MNWSRRAINFSWMIPNQSMKSCCFTKTSIRKGAACSGFQADMKVLGWLQTAADFTNTWQEFARAPCRCGWQLGILTEIGERMDRMGDVGIVRIP